MISIVIPTYNEAENISLLVPRIEVALKGRKIEILVVDDNSPDGTAGVARRLNKKYGNVRVLVQPEKRGIGVAHQAGYKAAKGDVIVTMDADLSHDPAEIPKMLELIDKGTDIVVGSRYIEGGSSDKKGINVAISKIGGLIAIRLFGFSHIKDYTNGFRAFRKEVFQSLPAPTEKGNAFLMEFLVNASRKGFKVVEIPVQFRERTKGESKTNLKKESLKTLKFILRSWLRSLLPNKN